MGMDFLASHELLVDPSRRCFLYQLSATVVRAEPGSQPTPLDHSLEEGIVRLSDSNWVSPPHMVLKDQKGV